MTSPTRTGAHVRRVHSSIRLEGSNTRVPTTVLVEALSAVARATARGEKRMDEGLAESDSPLLESVA